MKLLYQVTNSRLSSVVFLGRHFYENGTVLVCNEGSESIYYVRESEWHETPEAAWREIAQVNEKELHLIRQEIHRLMDRAKAVSNNMFHAFDEIADIKGETHAS